MSGTENGHRYLDTAAAAGHCGFSPRSFEKYRVTGGGPRYLKRGRRVLYAAEDLDAWMLAGARQSTSEISGKAA